MSRMKTSKKTGAAEPKSGGHKVENHKSQAEKHTSTKEFDELLSTLQDKFGEGAIMKLGDVSKVDVAVVPTGSFSLDLALGVGGLPRGRITEIFGPESSGKTTLALNVIAQAQKQGGKAAFIDAEHAMDPEYAAKLGVNINELLISQPDSGEEALSICETLARSNALDVIVVDSVAALVPVLAAELRPLRVNAVSPGVVDTPWWNFLTDEQKVPVFADWAAKTPVGRVGQAEDIAQAIAFLIVDTFISGQVIVCDGGLRLNA